MQTHRIHVTGGRERVLDVRETLFVFSDVLEVFVTGHPDVLVVVCSGRPRPARWLAELRAAGYRTAVRRRAEDAPRVCSRPLIPTGAQEPPFQAAPPARETLTAATGRRLGEADFAAPIGIPAGAAGTNGFASLRAPARGHDLDASC